MEKAIWAIQYLFFLIRKTWLIPVLALIQALSLLIAPQGRDVLMALNSDNDLVFQSFIFQISILFSGVLYFSGAYWLLFFSGTKGNLFEDSEHYPDSGLKIKAWHYHEFIQKYREYLIRLYTGILLFSPFFIFIASYSFVSFSSLRWFFGTAILFLSNVSILYFRKNRASFLLNAIVVFHSGLALWLEQLALGIKKFAIKVILPDHFKSYKQKQIKGQLPLTIDLKAESLFQTTPQIRGAFYTQLAIGLVLFSFLISVDVSILEVLGPAAVMQFGLCCWAILLIWLAYLNKVFLFPFNLILVLLFAFNSYFNKDHPILYSKNVNEIPKLKAISIENQFENWLGSRSKFKIKPDGSFEYDNHKFTRENPFVYLIINAEGGANRSGYWTALMLDSLRKKIGTEFDERLFAISSVSGGSMGALAYATARATNAEPTVSKSIHDFFKEDFLSGLTNTLIVGETFGALLPFYSKIMDRAVSFETSIDEKINRHFFDSALPDFSFGYFSKGERKSAFNPLFLLHATEVETGKRAILSNHRFNSQGFPNAVQVGEKLQKDISIGTAIHLGARFPVFSPSASVTDFQGLTRHFVDGGYYENGGYETTFDLVHAIEKSKFSGLVRPVVISISNSFEVQNSFVLQSNQGDRGAFLFNEIQSVIGTMVKIRYANLECHKERLIQYLNEGNQSHNSYIELDLKSNGDQIPMNWYLTNRARKNIQKRAIEVLKSNSRPLNPDSLFEKIQVHDKIDFMPIIIKDSNSKGENPRSINQRRTDTKQQQVISPASNSGLYYYSRKRKTWRLKSEADFKFTKLKPFKKRKKSR